MGKKLAACIAALSLAALCLCCGCASQTTSSTPSAESTYLSNVHQVIETASDNMDDFSAAITAGNETAATSALEQVKAGLTTLNGLDVPDSYKSAHDLYVKAYEELTSALGDYAAAYFASQDDAAAQNASSALEDIQARYDEAMKALSEADAILTGDGLDAKSEASA